MQTSSPNGKAGRTRVAHEALALAALAAAALATAPATRAQQGDAEIDIPFQKFVLPNGLRLIVHEDHKAPIVAVNVWYHVGSKNERPGRTGFAHLFEHLMFNGSEHYNDDYFKVLEPLGATDLNGTTNEDRTNYFQNVPTSALDVVLWMESDRMGYLLGAVDQAKLDEQRGVVQNEKRQGENQPYGKVWTAIAENTYPKGHPYSWSVIGSMEDLNAATLEDVREWFRTYYGAANAVLVIAGDVKTDEVKAKVERYFGNIPSGPPMTKHEVWVAKRTGVQRQVMQDRVPQARIYKVWNVPEWGSPDATYLDLVTDVLASGKTSRLYKRLVYEDRTATDVVGFLDLREIGSQVILWATAKPGVPLADVERAMDEELARFLREGPTPAELARVKAQYRANFLRGIERIGGFGGKSDVLAMNEVYAGRPDFYKVTLDRVARTTAADLRGAAQRWLSDGVYTLEVHPFPTYATSGQDVDRSTLPEPGAPPPVDFPEFQRATLANGLTVVLAERRHVPLVTMRLLLDAGYAADAGGLAGTTSLAMDMLDEGTRHRTALEISEALDRLGANLSTGSALDVSFVDLSVPRENLEPALEIFGDVVLQPSFPESELERLRAQRLAQIQQEKTAPVGMGLRVLPRLLYGEGHAYGNPLTGSGTEESVRKIARADLVRFHETWVRPNAATLVVVGAVSMAELRPRLERFLRDWRPAPVPEKNLAEVAPARGPAVYLLDRPGALQSVILAGQLVPPKRSPDDLALETANTILGGDFTSRVNMNLREEKGWSYGAGTILFDARAQRPFIAYAPVQTDKTAESLRELARELAEFVGARPPTDEELDRAKKSQTLTLPGRWETNNAVRLALADIVQFGLEDDYWDRYPERVRALGLDDVRAAATRILHPDRLVWVVVGDREKVEPGIRALGLGPLYEMDPDGNVLRQIAAAAAPTPGAR
jgi:zinc protease